jgi:hypothetical protein
LKKEWLFWQGVGGIDILNRKNNTYNGGIQEMGKTLTALQHGVYEDQAAKGNYEV